MKFTINTKLKADGFFGGAVNWPMDCKISIIQNEYILLKFDLVEEGLDLIQVLNQMFHTDWKEGALIASRIEFVMLAQLSSKSEVRKLKELYPELVKEKLPDVIQSLASSTTPSLCLWCLLQMNQIELFDHFIEIGYSDEKELNHLSVITYISNEQVEGKSYKDIRFEADLPDVMLFHMLSFTQVKIAFLMGEEKKFWLSGAIILHLFDEDYTFAGALEVNDTSCRAAMTIKSGKSDIPKLFDGNMTGISFEEGIQLYINHTWKSKEKANNTIETSTTDTDRNTTTICIVGSVPIGQAKLNGCIYLIDQKPELVTASLDQNSGALSISSLVKLCNPKIPWPEEYIDLTIYEGSEIYYLTEKNSSSRKRMDGSLYLPGFHAYVKMCLRLFTDFYMTGILSIQEKGVEAALLLTEKEIDFIVCQFGPAKNENGILFLFSTIDEEKKFGLKCSVSIFHKKIGDLMIACAKYKPTKAANSEVQLKAEVDMTEFIQEVFQPYLPDDLKVVLGMSYSKTAGFQLTNWPKLNIPDELKQLLKELQEVISNKSKDTCSMIWDIFEKSKLEVAYDVLPELKQVENDFAFALSLTLDFRILGIELKKVTYEDLLSIPVKPDFNFSDLPALILETIKNSMDSIISNVLSKPEVISLLVAYSVGGKAKQYAASLLCKKIVTPAEASSIGTAGTAVEVAVGGALSAAGGAAAGMGIGDMLAWFGAGFGAAALAALIAKASSNHDKTYQEEKQRKEEEEKKKEEEETRVPVTPEIRYISCREQCILIGWEDTDDTSYYDVRLYDGEDREQFHKDVPISEITFYPELDANYRCDIPITTEMTTKRYTIALTACNEEKRGNVVTHVIEQLQKPVIRIEKISDHTAALQYKLVVEQTQSVICHECILYCNGEQRKKWFLRDKEYQLSDADINSEGNCEVWIEVRAIHSLYPLCSDFSKSNTILIESVDPVEQIKQYIAQYGHRFTKESIIQDALQQNRSPKECFHCVIEQYPFSSKLEIAQLMYRVGYSYKQTIDVLREEQSMYRNMDILQLYKEYFLKTKHVAFTVQEIIRILREQGYDEKDMKREVLTNYPYCTLVQIDLYLNDSRN